MCTINLLKIGADIKYGPSFSLFSVTYQGGSKSYDAPHVNLSIPWHSPQKIPTVLSLLTWNCAISNFRGREIELASLYEWVEQENPVSVRFIIGRGGSGKSRLGAEFGVSLQIKDDWDAGFIDLTENVTYEIKNKKILFLIDSPEINKGHLSKFLKTIARLDQHNVEDPWKIRVLLLTRNNLSQWRDFLLEEDVFNIIDTRQIELEGIDEAAAHELYNSASEKASELLDKVVPPISKEAIGEWILMSNENKLPIFIVGAAICDVLELNDQSVKYTAKEIVESIAEYELNRLVSIAKNNNIEDKYFYAKFVASACISGLTPSTGTAQNVGEAVTPNVEPIKPDIIASAFTLLILKKMSSSDAVSLVWEAVSSNLPESLVTISRMIYETEISLKDLGYTAETILEQAIKKDLTRCRILFDHLNQDKSIYLCGITTEVCNTILETEMDIPIRASTLILLSNNLSQIGDHEKAIKATREAIVVVEELYESSPEKYGRLFVNTLNNLAGDCLENGLTEEAFENLRKASGIYDERIKKYSVPAIEYCIFLCNYGSYYLKVEEYSKALEFHQKAVKILEGITGHSFDIFRKELAFALLNISVCYQKKLDFPNALTSAKKALDYYEYEASLDLFRFEPQIARCCLNIATSYPANSKDESIRQHIERAICIYEKYVKKSFASYADDLANSYKVLSCYLEKNQHYEEAIAYSEKEIAIYLLNYKEGCKKKHLITKLFNAKAKISHLFLEVDLEKASEYIDKSIQMVSGRGGKIDQDLEPLYADLLLAKSRFKYLVGEIDEEINITTESKNIFRKSAKKLPEKYESDVARCLYVLGYLNITKNEREIAQAHLMEGIQILYPYFKKEPDLYEELMNTLLMAKDRLSSNS